MNLPVKPSQIESDYEVKLGVFEGPLDLLLYLVQKNELNPREIAIATITDQYLQYIEAGLQGGGVQALNLSNAGEFLVMAARLMRLKARELLPADQKDELEEMEYELDRQALIQQMLEYQKFKEAARVLRNFEGKNFGAFARGREDSGDDRKEEELEEEAGIFDLLSAFRNVVMQRPRRIPVHEVEIDDVTIEDRMQEVEIALNERGRSQFEDLFPHDNRTIVKVVTLMAMLELCKLDRVVFRQSRALGAIWVYRKARSSEFEMELKVDEGHQDPLPDFRPGLPELIREQAKQRTAQTALESALRELEQELANPGQAEKQAAAQAEAAAVQAAAGAPAADTAPEAGASSAAVEAAPAAGAAEGTPESTDLAAPAEDASGVAENEAATLAGAEGAMTSEAAEPSEAEAAASATEVAASATEPLVAVAASEEAPGPEEESALRDLLNRVREAPEPDLPVPGADADED